MAIQKSLESVKVFEEISSSNIARESQVKFSDKAEEIIQIGSSSKMKTQHDLQRKPNLVQLKAQELTMNQS